jgi:hypothetical protein
VERYCETDTLICTAHFPLPSIGRIVVRVPPSAWSRKTQNGDAEAVRHRALDRIRENGY